MRLRTDVITRDGHDELLRGFDQHHGEVKLLRLGQKLIKASSAEATNITNIAVSERLLWRIGRVM